MNNPAVSSYSVCGPTSIQDRNRPLNVVITGGCGFLGRHIAKSLYNEFKDVRITLMDLEPVDTTVMKFITDGVPMGQPVSYSVVDRDVTRLPHLLRVFKHTDVVFHCAAETGTRIGATRMSLVNVDGTKNVIRACKECGVQALVYSGSLMQNLKAGVTTQHGITESSWENTNDRLIAPILAKSLNRAEQLVLESGDNSLYTCSIRCPPLYGEFDKSLIPSAMYLTRALYGFYPTSGDPNVRMSAMYAGNAGWAHVCAAKKLLDQSTRRFVSRRFFYVGDETPSDSYSVFYMRFFGPLGYSQTFRIPLGLLEVLLYLISIFIILLSIFLRLQSSYSLLEFQRQVRLFTVSHTLVWSRARVYLGYKPKFSFHKALELSINNWYQFI